MRASSGLLLLLFMLTALVQSAAQAPAPVVERITTQFGRTTRVTLFSNHVAVVSIRSETEDYVHQATLNYDEYMVYLQAFERYSGEIGADPVTSEVESRDASTVLILHIGPDAPRIIRYSPLASLNLSAGKIASAMDDIQTRTLETLPGEYEINMWQPAVGDCVELRQGGTACVTMVAEDGTIVLLQAESSVSATVAKENRVEVILSIGVPQP